VQQVLDRRRAVVRPDKHRWVVGVERKRLPVGHLLLGAVKAMDRRLIVGSAEPAVGRPELELGKVGVAPHGVERGEQGRGVDAVADGVIDGGHELAPHLWLTPPAAGLARRPGSPYGTGGTSVSTTDLGHPCSTRKDRGH
jgi:hypothetical protein